MEWRVRKDETIEQKVIGGDKDTCYAPRSSSTTITANNMEEAKHKAEDWRR
jgi:hypothetical protein